MSSCQYRKSHCDEETAVRSFYHHNGISYTGKMTSLSWIRALSVLPSILSFENSTISLSHVDYYIIVILRQFCAENIKAINLQKIQKNGGNKYDPKRYQTLSVLSSYKAGGPFSFRSNMFSSLCTMLLIIFHDAASFSSASEFAPSTLETYKYLSDDFDFQNLQYFAEMSRRTLELSQENRFKSLSEPLIISMTSGGCL